MGPAGWDGSGPGRSGDLELDIIRLQVAIGPIYQLLERLSISGGPLWYYLDGDKRYDELGWFAEYDMGNCSELGGGGGAQLDLCESRCLSVEYQLTGDDDAFGLVLLWRL
jgi:hypothetical protein